MKVNFVICMFLVGAVATFPSHIYQQLLPAHTDSPGAGSPEDYHSDSEEQRDLEKSRNEPLLLAQTDSPGAGSREDYHSDSEVQRDFERSPITASKLPNAQTNPDKNNSLNNNDENQSLSEEKESLQGSDTGTASNDKGRIVLPTLTAGGADKPEPKFHECAVWRKNYEELRELYVKLSLRYTDELIKHDDEIRRLQCSSLDKKMTQRLLCNALN